jgi:hypothetical protein
LTVLFGRLSNGKYFLKIINEVSNIVLTSISAPLPLVSSNGTFKLVEYASIGNRNGGCELNLIQMWLNYGVDEIDKVKMYLESATFGIGKLEAVVATGVKQKDIYDKHVLEKYLDLDNILVPLQSAHTSSGKDEPKKEDEKPEDNGEETVKVNKDNEEST